MKEPWTRYDYKHMYIGTTTTCTHSQSSQVEKLGESYDCMCYDAPSKNGSKENFTEEANKISSPLRQTMEYDDNTLSSSSLSLKKSKLNRERAIVGTLSSTGSSNKGPFGCQILGDYIDMSLEILRNGTGKTRQFSPMNHNKAPFSLKALQKEKMKSHIFALSVRKCGEFFLKVSCRPPLQYNLGRQSWAELVARAVDTSLGFGLTYPSRGVVLPVSVISFPEQEIRDSCMFKFGPEKYILGYMMRPKNFRMNASDWLTNQCQHLRPQFLQDFFKLAILDYLVLNTDRNESKNWFEADGRLAAVDNGAWAFENHRDICHESPYVNEVLVQIKLLANKDVDPCPFLTKSTRPICTLAQSVNSSKFIHEFLNDNSLQWSGELLRKLQSDPWFQAMPYLVAEKPFCGIKRASIILSRDMDSCYQTLLSEGMNQQCDINSTQVVRFITHEVERRYLTAQHVIGECYR